MKCCQPCVSFLVANLLPASFSHRGISKFGFKYLELQSIQLPTVK